MQLSSQSCVLDTKLFASRVACRTRSARLPSGIAVTSFR